MTNTTASHDQLLERAAAFGTDHGTMVGSWVIVDESDNARKLLAMHEDGDPEFDDVVGYDAPLSGEWADSWTPENLRQELDLTVEEWENDELSNEVCTAYEQAHRDAFVAEVMRAVEYQLAD